MVINGVKTSMYLQLDLAEKIDQAVDDNPDIYKSRNAFINGSISRELRKLGYISPEIEEQCRTS